MDYYIAKLNAATGEAVWAKTFGGVRNWEMFNSVVADEAGNLYAVATFWQCIECTFGNASQRRVLLLLWPLQTIGAKIIYL